MVSVVNQEVGKKGVTWDAIQDKQEGRNEVA